MSGKTDEVAPFELALAAVCRTAESVASRLDALMLHTDPDALIEALRA